MKTELICIMDASGSMSGLVNETLSGINRFIEDQKAVAGEARITVVTFDTRVKMIRKGVPIAECAAIANSQADYWIGGYTALYDALGATIEGEGRRIKDDGWAEKVIVCTTTDGAENASTEYRHARIKEIIQHAEQHGWTFLFLGANIDAPAVAMSLGMQGANAMKFTANAAGANASYASFSATTRNLRTGVGGQSLTSTVAEEKINLNPA